MGAATLIGVVKSFARDFLVWLGRAVVSPLVVFFARRPLGEELPISVHMLVSSKTWEMGLLAVLSLEHFSGKRWLLVFHDDGSVSEKAEEAILTKFPGARFVRRAEAEQVVAQHLADFSACRRNRAKHNLFLKFFDPIPFVDGEKYLILDSDVFFFRRPTELLEWAVSEEREILYNRDVKEVYCLPRAEIEAETGVKLWESFNSGLVCIRREAIDLALSEKLLETFEARAHHPQFFEQTLYALCASQHGVGGELPRQYEVSWNMFRQPDAICRHYVGPAKLEHLYFEGVMVLFYRMTLGLGS